MNKSSWFLPSTEHKRMLTIAIALGSCAITIGLALGGIAWVGSRPNENGVNIIGDWAIHTDKVQHVGLGWYLAHGEDRIAAIDHSGRIVLEHPESSIFFITTECLVLTNDFSEFRREFEINQREALGGFEVEVETSEVRSGTHLVGVDYVEYEYVLLLQVGEYQSTVVSLIHQEGIVCAFNRVYHQNLDRSDSGDLDGVIPFLRSQ